MKFRRIIAEILAVVLCVNTLSISTLAENEAQDFIEVVERVHYEAVVDQWKETEEPAESRLEAFSDDSGWEAAAGPEEISEANGPAEEDPEEMPENGSAAEEVPEKAASDASDENAAEENAEAGSSEQAEKKAPQPEAEVAEAKPEEIVAAEEIQEEIVAAETVEGEAAEAAKEEASEATPSEVQESAGGTLLGDASVEAQAYYYTDEAERVYGKFKDVIDQAVRLASASVVLLDNVSDLEAVNLFYNGTDEEGKIKKKLPESLTINLNGYVVSGSDDSQLLNAQNGTITLKNELTGETNGTREPETEGGIINTGKGCLINVGSGNPTVIVDSGRYIANGVSLHVFGGKVIINKGKLPYVESKNSDAIDGSGAGEIAGGIFSSAVPLKFLKKNDQGEQMYDCYYVAARKYYVVMEKHPIYLRGVKNIPEIAEDRGFDTLLSLTKEIEARVSSGVTNHTVYLMENYNVAISSVAGKEESTDIVVAEGVDVTLDLYGHQLTGMTSLKVPYIEEGSTRNSHLTITDTLIGGFIAIPASVQKVDYVIDPTTQKPVVTTSNITITGGTYDTKIPDVLRQLLGKGTDGEQLYDLQENTYGDNKYYTVVKLTDKILVPGKGSAATFEEALAIAKDGDTLMLIDDFDEKTDEQGEILSDSSIKDAIVIIGKKLSIDLNGHTVNSSGDKTLWVKGGAIITVKDDSGERGTLSNTKAAAVVVQVEGESSIDISNVEIKEMRDGNAIVLDGNTKNTADLHGVDVYSKDGYCLVVGGNSSVLSIDGVTSVITGKRKILIRKNGTLRITAGCFQNLIFSDCEGTVVLSGGTYSGTLQFDSCVMGSIDLTGGTYNCNMDLVENKSPWALNLKGGAYTSKDLFSALSVQSQKNRVYVYAGDFVADPTPYLAPGYYTTVLPSGHFSATRPKFSTVNTRIDSEIYLRVTTGVKTTDPQRTGDKPMEMMILFEDLSANRAPYTALVPVDTTETVPSAKHLLYPQCMADKYQLTLFVHNPNVTQRQTTDARIVDGKTFSPVQTYNSMNMVEDGIINHPKKKTDFSLRTLFTSTMPLEAPNEAQSNSVADADKIKHLYASFLYFAACNQRYQTNDPTNWSYILKDPGWCDNGYADEILVRYNEKTKKWDDIPQAKFEYNEHPMGDPLQWTWTYGYPGGAGGYPVVPKATSDSVDHRIFKSYSLTLGSHFAVKLTLDETKMDTGTYDYQAVITCEDDDYKQYYAATTIPLKIESGVCTFSYPVYYPELQRLFKFDIQKAEKGTENWKSEDYIVRSVENFLYEYENRAGADKEKGSRNVFVYKYPDRSTGNEVFEDDKENELVKEGDTWKARGDYYYPLRIRKLVQSVFEFGVSCYQYRKYYKGY